MINFSNNEQKKSTKLNTESENSCILFRKETFSNLAALRKIFDADKLITQEIVPWIISKHENQYFVNLFDHNNDSYDYISPAQPLEELLKDIHPEDRQEALAHFQKLKNGEQSQHQHRHISKNNEVVYHLSIGNQCTSEPDCILGFCKDTTSGIEQQTTALIMRDLCWATRELSSLTQLTSFIENTMCHIEGVDYCKIILHQNDPGIRPRSSYLYSSEVQDKLNELITAGTKEQSANNQANAYFQIFHSNEPNPKNITFF